jgi:hypothetical protein
LNIAVDVFGAAPGHLGDRLLGGGIDGRKGRARTRADPVIVDEELVLHALFRREL